MNLSISAGLALPLKIFKLSLQIPSHVHIWEYYFLIVAVDPKWAANCRKEREEFTALTIRLTYTIVSWRKIQQAMDSFRKAG